MPGVVVRLFVVRAAALWIALRVLLVIVASGPELMEGSIVVLGAEVAPAIAVLSGGCAPIDVARRRERALWGNLGISNVAIMVVFAAVAIACEAVLGLARM
jgi:hypothetical protein